MPEGLLAGGEFGGFFLLGRHQGFHTEKISALGFFDMDFSLEPAVLLAVGKAVVVIVSGGKPADLPPGILPAQAASGGGHLPVLHGLVFGGKLFGNKAGAVVVNGKDFLFPAFRVLIIIKGKIFEDRFRGQSF